MLRSIPLKFYDSLAGLGLPLAAVAVFLLTDLRWLGIALCVAGAGYGVARFRLDGLGRQIAGRALLLSALLIDVGQHAPAAARTPLVIAGLLLVGVVVNEPRLVEALATGRLAHVNLRVRRSTVKRLSEPGTVYSVLVALTATYLVVTALAGVLPAAVAWLALAVCLGAAATLGGVTVAAWRERRSVAYRGDADVRAALLAHAPRFAVHFAGPLGSAYQLLMWLPHLDSVGDPYVIIARHRHPVPELAAATTAPIVVATRIADLEHSLTPGIKAVFYVNNSMQNTQCVRFGELTHVQLMHGDSDKPASHNPVSAMYDLVFVAGQAGIDRYHNHGVQIPRSRFRIVGRPQVAGIEVSRRPVREATAPVALYAPTWTGDSTDVNYCSLRLGEKIVSGLLARGVTVILRPHPYTRRNPAAAKRLDRLEDILAEDRARTGRGHRWGADSTTRMSLVECMNAADAMICDVSGVATDWLYSEKPFAITDVQAEGEAFPASFPVSRAAYVIRHDASNMGDVLERLLDTDPLAALRREMKAHYLGDIPESRYAGAFVEAVRRCYRASPGDGAPDAAPVPAEPQEAPV